MVNAFNKIHPLTGFLYFTAVIGFSMFLMNPVCIAVSLFCALINALIINRKKAVGFSVKFVLPMILLILIINPVFNHRGATILSYLPWQNPLTLEAVIYGMFSALMISSVMLWFSVFNSVMTSDKIICLFGRIIPSLSLVISMTLRFVPRFNAHFKELKSARISPDKPTFLFRIKSLIRELSVMISWSLENAIETADSMKSRGYGLKGRTSYNIFSFKKPDGILLAITLSVTSVLGILLSLGYCRYSYYPVIKIEFSGFISIAVYILYFTLMMIPAIINIGEGLKWKRLKSAI
jgi:energy-coupling factor transport system permease protein